VIIINSGTPEQAREVGALMYVGQPEYDAGYAAGLRAAGDGVGSLPLREPLHLQPSSTERCQGFADGLGVELGNQMIDSGRTRPRSRTGSWPISTPTRHRRVLTLGPTSGRPDDPGA
jgi:simple sugar transport system substrate-binding protein